jgi:predicted DNA binding protein
MALTEMSDSLGISNATCSDVLHRAETNVVKSLNDEHAGASGMLVQ